MKGYDFGGWATKNNLRCADGRTIRQNAFQTQDGTKVPLFWNHQHNDPENVLGHGILENRPEGVYVYGFFNNTSKASAAKEQVAHGDITTLSIWANNLQQDGGDVLHGVIREVSLVPAGANPGAFIESVLAHGLSIDEDDTEGILYTGEDLELSHSNKEDPKGVPENKEEKPEDGETVEEVFGTLTDKQKKAVAIVVQQAISDKEKEVPENEEEKEDKEVRHSIFENQNGDKKKAPYISHEDMGNIMKHAKQLNSFKDALIAYQEENDVIVHAIDTTGMVTATGTQTYGFNDPSMLFPEYKTMSPQPEWLSRNMDWVNIVMGEVHKTPFARIKSVFADITEDEARARGYIKGKEKKEEVFTTLKRTTSPQTIYKKQKLDRDDIVDITEFDVIAWIRSEMRIMLNEEIARAILIGDGRPKDSDDKIKEEHIRSIMNDVPLFNVKVPVDVSTTDDDTAIAKKTINQIIRSRKKYKGSGNPIFFTNEDVLTEMLLIEDSIGHKIYKTEAELATALRVSRIVAVEPMTNQTLEIGSNRYPLIGIIVNLKDYNVGTDRGGQIESFEDFDIDFNQHKYLLEGRMSGSLVKPFSALTVYRNKSVTSTTPPSTTPPSSGGTD